MRLRKILTLISTTWTTGLEERRKNAHAQWLMHVAYTNDTLPAYYKQKFVSNVLGYVYALNIIAHSSVLLFSFTGVKLECGKQYSQLVDRSFHISHAALQIGSRPGNYCFPGGCYEVHAIVEKTDYILCYLGWGTNNYGTSGLVLSTVQQSLNLNISEGEEIILYIKKTGIADKDQTSADASVYLTGYFVEEPTFAPNLDELLDDDEHLLDDDSEDDGDFELHGDDLLEGQGSDIDEQSLTTLLLEGSLEDSDSDEDFTAELETPVERRTRKRLAQPPVVEEIKVG
jgi:hypothetical protein